jgi:ankyrin repeat protein
MLDYLLAEWPGATKAQDKDGYTPLHRLITRSAFPEQAVMIERLIDADPLSCGLVTNNGYTTFHLFCGWATDSSYACELSTKLLAAHPSAISLKASGRGDLPLHVLCRNWVLKNKLPLIESLLTAYKEGVSTMNSFGELPVHIAAYRDPEVTFRLIKAYPEALSRESNIRNNILAIVASTTTNDFDFLLEYLIQHNPELAGIADGNGKFPLHEIAHSGFLYRVTRVYAAYLEAVRMFTDKNFLPLHYAVSYYDDDPLSENADVIRFLLRQCPEAANMRRLPDGVNPADVDAEEEEQQGSDEDDDEFNQMDESEPMKLTPYKLSLRTTKCTYIHRIILRACPEADPEKLREINYAARRQLLFLSFAAITGAQQGASTVAAAGKSSRRVGRGGAEFIHHLRRLMYIGEDLGLLKHVASFL